MDRIMVAGDTAEKDGKDPSHVREVSIRASPLPQKSSLTLYSLIRFMNLYSGGLIFFSRFNDKCRFTLQV